MLEIDEYFKLIKQAPSKKWNPQEDNYFIVFSIVNNRYMTFTVNDFFVDPLRRYYTKETAQGLINNLNENLKD